MHKCRKNKSWSFPKRGCIESEWLMTFKWAFVRFSSIQNLLDFLGFRKHEHRILLRRGGKKRKSPSVSIPFYQKYAFQNWPSAEFSFASDLAQGSIVEVWCQRWQLILPLGSNPALWNNLARSGLEQSHAQWCPAWPLGKKWFSGPWIHAWKRTSSTYASEYPVPRTARRPG